MKRIYCNRKMLLHMLRGLGITDPKIKRLRKAQLWKLYCLTAENIQE
jgi:hypothetical protein